MLSPAIFEDAAAVDLRGVGVRYRLLRGRTRSIKEFCLQLAGGRLQYEDFWALRDLDLRVDGGDQLAVIGRNGAGKSTLLQVMARVLRPTRGMATIRGRVAPLLQLGAGFDWELTGRENVFLNGALLGMSRRELHRRFDEIVGFAELEPFIDAPLRTYSSGMAARLGFAMATASEPDIMLLDEVLSVGDAAFREKCVDRMKAFTRRGVTMVIATHDASFVRRECTRALWLNAGRVEAFGEPHEVMDAYEAFLAGDVLRVS